MTASAQPALVEGLQPLADRYDLILCDVWGVLHNGLKAYEAASEALTRFRQRGGQVVLVSNAPRPGAAIMTQLDGFKVPRESYDAVVTSGDLTRLMEREEHFFNSVVSETMTRNPKTAEPDALAAAAVGVMERAGVMALPVVEEDGRVVGMVHLHDLMRAGAV